MIHSFLNKFLPEDEYKRLKILYFMAKTTSITIGVLVIFGFLKYILQIPYIDGDIFLLLGFFPMSAYPLIRYIFSGIEHTDLYSKQDYHKQLHLSCKRWLLEGDIWNNSFYCERSFEQ